MTIFSRLDLLSLPSSPSPSLSSRLYYTLLALVSQLKTKKHPQQATLRGARVPLEYLLRSNLPPPSRVATFPSRSFYHTALFCDLVMASNQAPSGGAPGSLPGAPNAHQPNADMQMNQALQNPFVGAQQHANMQPGAQNPNQPNPGMAMNAAHQNTAPAANPQPMGANPNLLNLVGNPMAFHQGHPMHQGQQPAGALQPQNATSGPYPFSFRFPASMSPANLMLLAHQMQAMQAGGLPPNFAGFPVNMGRGGANPMMQPGMAMNTAPGNPGLLMQQVQYLSQNELQRALLEAYANPVQVEPTDETSSDEDMADDELEEPLDWDDNAAEREARTQEDLEALGLSAEDLSALLDEETEEDQKALSIEVDGHQRKFKFSSDYVIGHFGGEDPYDVEAHMSKLSLKHNSSVDLVSALSQNLELAIELGKHLRPEDVASLYIACPGFRAAISGHFLSSIRMWVDHKAPEAGRIFSWRLFRSVLIRDPTGREWDDAPRSGIRQLKNDKDNVRLIPGLRYLQLVLGRERCCREIMAVMARMGFRVPDSMYGTLMRLWILMELSTTAQRKALLRNEDYFTDEHLYNVQFLVVKLAMLFNHPYFGPHTLDMVHLMLGQRGLYPLWQCLTCRRYRSYHEVLALKVQYDQPFPFPGWRSLVRGNKIFGVPIGEIGLGHAEGWGNGVLHLARPDELVPREAVLRGLDLDRHIRHMMVWGYIDFETGENLVPAEDEMYVSDEEKTLANVDTVGFWQPRHALKKRWADLSPEQQQDIVDEDEDEHLRAMAFCNLDDHDSEYYISGPDDDDDDDDDDDGSEYDLNWEINRGYRMQPQPKEPQHTVPTLDDHEGWEAISAKALADVKPNVTATEVRRILTWKARTKKTRTRARG
ncbi:hypothetical protein ACJZ2D_006852 [Fusarium nematophilum]